MLDIGLYSFNSIIHFHCKLQICLIIILRFDDHHHYYCRYGRVICCIGVNPDKVYDVTPQTRAQILREMLSGSDGRTRCKNVQVEGMFDCLMLYMIQCIHLFQSCIVLLFTDIIQLMASLTNSKW